MARVAMIGATGLIGRDLARRLMADGHQLLIIGRRMSGIEGAQEKILPVAEWAEALDGEAVDVAISTLGTTRKAAGSMAAFEAIDRYAVAAFASAARKAGAGHWMMVSSVGADAGSRSGYLAVKGKAEADVLALHFARTDIFRPGLLIGDRTENRPGERFAILVSPLINPLLRGALARYQSIGSDVVAQAMALAVGAADKGVFIHQNRAIRTIAGQG